MINYTHAKSSIKLNGKVEASQDKDAHHHLSCAALFWGTSQCRQIREEATGVRLDVWGGYV